MNQGDILLKAILAEPDDDLPRLAYADWLEETGSDPERAEFIQIQIERARRSRLGIRMSDEERAMRDREHELWEGNRGRWFGDLYDRIIPPIVRRGFLDEIEIDGQRFADLPFPDLFAKHPLRKVTVANQWDQYAQQISSRIPPQLRFLHLGGHCEMTRSEASGILSYSLENRWADTLEELSYDIGNIYARDILFRSLPKVRIRAFGVLWSAAGDTSIGAHYLNRTIFESRYLSTTMLSASKSKTEIT